MPGDALRCPLSLARVRGEVERKEDIVKQKQSGRAAIAPAHREARLQELQCLLDELEPDELAVLLQVAQGIHAGRSVYGPLRVSQDERDFVRETLEEVRDGLVYVGARLVQLAAESGPNRTVADGSVPVDELDSHSHPNVCDRHAEETHQRPL